MKQNDWPKMENSRRFIKMVERTAKMSQSCGHVGVRGRLARSGPRQRDRGAAWTRGHGSTWDVRGSTQGTRGDGTDACGDGSIGCAPLPRSVTDWLVRVMDQWVHHPRLCIAFSYNIYIWCRYSSPRVMER
jgi:hypothetical protein